MKTKVNDAPQANKGGYQSKQGMIRVKPEQMNSKQTGFNKKSK